MSVGDAEVLRKTNRGLRLRIFVLVAAPLLLPLVQMTVMVPYQQAKSLKESGGRSARAALNMIAANVAAGLAFEDAQGVASGLEAAKAIPELSYMVVTDATGKVVGQIGDPIPPEDLRPDATDLVTGESPSHVMLAGPIVSRGQRYGVLHARFSKANRIKQVLGFFYWGVGTSVVVLAIAGLMAWFLGRGFNQTFQQLRASMLESARRVDAAVRQLAEVSTEQTSAAAEEAAALQESSSVASQVGTAATTAAQRAGALIDSGARAELCATEGLTTVTTATETMRQVREQMAAIATGIGALSKRASAINDIANTVALLAERTNLLAVNAAIEAARSGQHGKGFGVVAQEMRALADGSNRSAAQVKALVAEIQEAISRAVEDVREGERRAERGAENADRAGDTIRKFADTTREFAGMGKEIAENSGQQHMAIEQLVESITHASEAGTQQLKTTHKVEDTARALKALSAELLKSLDEGQGKKLTSRS